MKHAKIFRFLGGIIRSLSFINRTGKSRAVECRMFYILKAEVVNSNCGSGFPVHYTTRNTIDRRCAYEPRWVAEQKKMWDFKFPWRCRNREDSPPRHQSGGWVKVSCAILCVSEDGGCLFASHLSSSHPGCRKTVRQNVYEPLPACFTNKCHVTHRGNFISTRPLSYSISAFARRPS